MAWCIGPASKTTGLHFVSSMVKQVFGKLKRKKETNLECLNPLKKFEAPSPASMATIKWLIVSLPGQSALFHMRQIHLSYYQHCVLSSNLKKYSQQTSCMFLLLHSKRLAGGFFHIVSNKSLCSSPSWSPHWLKLIKMLDLFVQKNS